jgi:hypothetical protein
LFTSNFLKPISNSGVSPTATFCIVKPVGIAQVDWQCKAINNDHFTFNFITDSTLIISLTAFMPGITIFDKYTTADLTKANRKLIPVALDVINWETVFNTIDLNSSADLNVIVIATQCSGVETKKWLVKNIPLTTK